ncbi:hypothetical protein [Streptomyces flaveus]
MTRGGLHAAPRSSSIDATTALSELQQLREEVAKLRAAQMDVRETL